MNGIKRVQYLLQQTYDGECFHGDSIAAVLEDVDPQQSVWKPEHASHCIWQIVRHMSAWLDVIRQRFTSPTAIELDADENYPPTPPPTQESWNDAKTALHASLEALIHAAGEFSENKLDQMTPERGYTYAMLLHGAVHHNLYHLGQIGLLKAMYKHRSAK